MDCFRCGSPMIEAFHMLTHEPTVYICQRCGAFFNPQTQKPCPDCSDLQDAEADYCNQCGYRFSAATEETERLSSEGKKMTRLPTHPPYPVYHRGVEGCNDVACYFRWKPAKYDPVTAELVMHKDGTPTHVGELLSCGSCHRIASHFHIVADGVYEVF